jgi:aspartyl-tRNA(Asn)/glutamyl-tRNA(Gln) amidotransferase subunit B
MASGVKYEPVIGLEVHVQLATRTKIFCGCPTASARRPIRNVCPVCLGLPGALPVLNRQAVVLGDEGVAGAELRSARLLAIFARKNYFYPDLPKGYQISQYDQPLAEHGWIDIQENGATKRIGITRIASGGRRRQEHPRRFQGFRPPHLRRSEPPARR